ncbi:1,8-cineole synthase 1, chloroplastic isoform X3 [Raphanus sativus]|uniref:1,8-cineole synthase 1, chloroplastic isoform X3 n=1 Tax=Raphanus sativus TaxID=3726 RepID=A0A9W3BYP9_RAPSA|nr:1,8-cineole synthase 1, chloroplastic isoform X3 [Raphanus sativus]
MNSFFRSRIYMCVRDRDFLKEKVRKVLDETTTPLEQLELVDKLQRLGVSYHFESKIHKILTDFYHNSLRECGKENLHATALKFRLLREHGFNVSEGIFDVFISKIEDGTFESGDIRGLISVYEASYLATKLDTKLHKVIRAYANQQLRKIIDSPDHNIYDVNVLEMAVEALEMPYHWRMKRLETRRYIDAYSKHDVLIEFAKIDFNIVQAVHQEELKYLSSWWEETGLSNQLHFARDRIVENYFWTVGQIQEPHFGYVRRKMTKINALITTIDDIYDVYGTLDELQRFTDIVENWDVNRLDELPEYMKLCYLVLYNEINSIGRDILKDKNINVIPFLKKSWGDLCKAYLVEAKWHKRKHKPSVEEYMQNAWISISAPTSLAHFYCVFSDQISSQVLETLSRHQHHVVRCSAIVLRLANDLGTSPDELKRGDVLKSVQCYMNEARASEKKPRVYVQEMISKTWDEMNYEIISHDSSFLPRGFVEAAINLARTSQCMYQYGDGHGSPDKAKTVDRVLSILVNPIPLD